ncbi:MAG: 2-isopropylmalate synthase [Acidimicrobiia bacterium]|nr:MAG: 2-isopropylmalate synthase [Acidimicrobiia bacterium]
MTDRVLIFDTTLRDGEQSPGIALNTEEKLEIAGQLTRLGVDIIEAGFPAASDGDFEAVQAIARQIEGPVIAALARANEADVDAAWQAIEDAKRPRIHVFIATSPIHMEHKLRMEPAEVTQAVVAAVTRAHGLCDDVEFSPEDATRSDPDFMIEVCRAAVDAGATTINIPDTVGYATPGDFGQLITRVVAEVKGERDDIVISAHCHNDLGLAVANALAAVDNGARQVEGAINGIGERAGNTSIEEVVMALQVRSDAYDVETGVHTAELYPTSQLVSELTGYPVQFNKAVVGRNAFAHESGIHQHGILRERTTYEIMDPEGVGQAGTVLALGKHSGRAAFRDALDKIGVEVEGDALEDAFARFKQLADLKVQFTDRDLEAIVDEQSTAEDLIELLGVQVSGGTAVTPRAKVTVQTRGMEFEFDTEGDGMVDAIFEAATAAFGVEATLLGYNVRPLTPGSDAIAEIEVTIRINGGVYSGIGVSTDVVEGSARAFMAALNRAAAANVAKKVAAAATE